jgi:3-hexulose-6-phosphate synthase
MKIQVSFDISNLEVAIDIASKVKDYCDILEVGTILIHKYGIKAVKEFTKKFPQMPIMADTKIVDRGKEITEIYSKSGVKWISVMAGTSNTVIHRVCSETQKNDILVMLDTIDSVMPGQVALDAKNLGVDAILFHKAHEYHLGDNEPKSNESLLFLEELDIIKGNTTLPIFISAGINRENINKIIAAKPYGIIIGKSITDAKDPQEEAKFYYDLCKTNK